MLKEYSSRSAALEAQDGAETERIRSIERLLREAEQREAAEVLRLRAERDRLAAQHLLLQERALQQTDAAAAATDILAQTLLVSLLSFSPLLCPLLSPLHSPSDYFFLIVYDVYCEGCDACCT